MALARCVAPGHLRVRPVPSVHLTLTCAILRKRLGEERVGRTRGLRAGTPKRTKFRDRAPLPSEKGVFAAPVGRRPYFSTTEQGEHDTPMWEKLENEL
jgi:hypothetical protein